jgi:hypothetical protein
MRNAGMAMSQPTYILSIGLGYMDEQLHSNDDNNDRRSLASLVTTGLLCRVASLLTNKIEFWSIRKQTYHIKSFYSCRNLPRAAQHGTQKRQ